MEIEESVFDLIRPNFDTVMVLGIVPKVRTNLNDKKRIEEWSKENGATRLPAYGIDHKIFNDDIVFDNYITGEVMFRIRNVFEEHSHNRGFNPLIRTTPREICVVDKPQKTKGKKSKPVITERELNRILNDEYCTKRDMSVTGYYFDF